MSLPQLLGFVEDPGAANYFVGVLAALRGLADVRLHAAGAAEAYLTQQGIAVVPTSDDVSPRSLLRPPLPGLVLVGTSENPLSPGLELVHVAAQAGVPTVGLVDACVNAAHRFRGTSCNPLAHAPEWLVVPDSWTRDAFLGLGYAADRIVVCGHPHYDRVRAYGAALSEAHRAALRKRLFPAAPDGSQVVVFAAELSTGLDPAQYRRSGDYLLRGRGGADGRTEVVIEEFLDALAPLRDRVYAVLRLHPKHRPGDLQAYEAAFDLVSAGGDGLEVCAAADVVVGITSMILLEAAILGRRTLAIVPRELEREWLPSIRAGATPCAGTRQEVRQLLAATLRQERGAPQADFLAFGALGRLREFFQTRLSEVAGAA